MKSHSDTEINWKDYYTELDELPLFNWIKCNNGKTEYVRRKIEIGTELNDVEIFSMLYDQYIDQYGLSKMHKRLLETMKSKAILELTYVETRERFKLTEIQLKEAELKSMLMQQGSGMSIEQSLIHLSKWMGYHLNPKEITVTEYYNILNEYGKANKAQ